MKVLIDIDDAIYEEISSCEDCRYDSLIKAYLAIKCGRIIPNNDIGEFSDGYHTFNQLYHQRAMLFATIVNLNKDISWKSWKHEDGKYCFGHDGEWFIVGVDTPEGSYTYHYSKEYWDLFKCQELECGKPWDGHTEKDVDRLLSLESVHPNLVDGTYLIGIDVNESEDSE